MDDEFMGDEFTPSWRRKYLGEFNLEPDMCWNCGLEVRELSRKTSFGRTLNKGIWYHIESEGRLCDSDGPQGSRGPKAYPLRDIQ